MGKSYPLLEKAPKDHASEEFLNFLRANNEVIAEHDCWLVIANCKYDTPTKRWFTAFVKDGKHATYAHWDDLFYLLEKYEDWAWVKKASDRQTIKRFHIHLHQ